MRRGSESVTLEKIAEAFSLDLIIMFGSRARGDNIKESDTDIAIRSTRDLNLDEELRLAAALDKFFPDVDLCNIRRASPLLLGAIGQDARLIYQQRESLFEEFKIFAWNQYMDFKPQLDRIREHNRSEIERFDKEDGE
jgi:predicted nucleotidyltransferase